MSAALQSGGVSLGQNHAQQARRSSMLLGSRKSSSATAVSTLTSSSSLSSSTSASSACPHTHRQNHNSSKLPTFRSADLLNSGSSCKARPSALPALQHCAPDSAPNHAATGPAPGQGPGPSVAPERGNPQGPGQERAPEGSIPPASDPQQNPPINPVATAPAHSSTAGRQGRQSVLHSKQQPETPAAAASEPVRLPRTRASTLIPSPSAPASAPTNSGESSSSTKKPSVKSTPPTKRSSSLPTSDSGAEHVSPPDNTSRVNYSSAGTSPSAPQFSAPAPAPAPAPSTTVVPQPAEPAPGVSHTTTPTNATPATTSDSTTTTNPTSKPTSFPRSQQGRRPPLSFSGQPSPNPSSASLGTQRRHTFESAQNHQASTDKSTKDWSSGQRELLLPKSLSSTSSDENRSTVSVSRRPPPLSYKPPPSLSATQSPTTPASASPTVTTPVRVPPIRSFRSSGSRRSLVIDPASRQKALEDSGDGAADMDSREHTLRALEGRSEDYMGRVPPSGSVRPSGGDPDDTTDMFLNIAHEESIRPSIESSPNAVGDHGAISRVARSSHRRPLSAAIPSYQPMSPPQIGRRLSDQRETSRTRDNGENGAADQAPRGLPYRSLAREKAMSVHPGEDLSRRATASFRSGSTTPRSLAFHDTGDAGGYARRRTSISESVTQRTTPYKQSNLGYGQYRSPVYHSSPLAPRAEPQHGAEYGHGPEGTESTASTTGPSTVWDELDDLKSRINRLEFTGKLPSTSGAAMSRVSDERPHTANTTATNMSSSPKRNAGSTTNGQQAEAGSTISAGQKEAHPLLHAALAKSKSLLGPESYRALESVATDSLALLSLMGGPGQPGPISSGASTIGGQGVTDRQLRRKADSVCRSITELSLALNGEYSRTAPHNSNTQQTEGPTTPTLNGFGNVAAPRRSSTVADPAAMRVTTSPRTMTKLEERRNNMLNSSIPSPRLATPTLPTPSLAPPSDAMQGRRSSLLISRRRAGTEEPEDGRRSSLLLRTRRAGTEEPEESNNSGRKPSLLLRPRRGTVGEDDDDAHFRAPSRAATEVAPSSRAISRDYSSPGADPASLTSSALPRRRLHNSPALNSRFPVPSSPAPSARRFADSSGNGPERPGDERNGAAKPYSIGQTAMLNRTTSISRRPNRDSTMMNTQGTSQVGSYR